MYFCYSKNFSNIMKNIFNSISIYSWKKNSSVTKIHIRKILQMLWKMFLIQSLYILEKKILISKYKKQLCSKANNPANIYLFKVNNRNTRKRCEIFSKLTIKTPEWRRHRSGVLIVNFENISHLFLVVLLLTLNK